ncbi:MAG: sulfatase-like hydrolase/transferase [Verrucomicrobiota bacterium]
MIRLTLACFFYASLLALPLLSFAAETGIAQTEQNESAAPRPNILYFYVDDMGWGSIGPNGQEGRRAKGLPHVKTPTLDELAAEGLNFTRGYGCTVCSPARSSQQTGYHQGHTFADRNDPDNAKKAIRRDDLTMGDVLAEAGYTTGYWGKWGYGGSKNRENPTLDNIQTLPTSHGYEHVLAELHHVRAHTFFQPTLWYAPAPKDTEGGLTLIPNSMSTYLDGEKYPAKPAHQDHPDYPEIAYCDDVYAMHCLDFVRAGAKAYQESGTPFFGILAVQIPHAPFDEIEAIPEWDEAYKEEEFFHKLSDQTRQWAAMVTRIGAHFGNILEALEDPNADGDPGDSIADNTLVIFMSDNGGPGGKNNEELDANGGLSGNKGSILEGGIRVPTLMRWPSMIHDTSLLQAGTNYDQPIDVTDLLPTFCDLAGVTAPLGLDGVSIAPTLTGKGKQRHREFLIHEAGRNASIIRGQYKLIIGGNPKGKNSRSAPDKNTTPLLFDLDADPAEKDDISDDHPELVDELHALLLGERVTEGKGFANTYHRWEGTEGTSTSDPDNWSDYVYENAGITYTTDVGAPQLSWTALIDNGNAAVADEDVEFLALEVRGNQELELARGVTLTARNELRLSEGATVSINESAIHTERWVDVRKGATLEGKGVIVGELINEGTLDLTLTSQAPALEVVGTAILGGHLVVESGPSFVSTFEESIPLLVAESIEGEFLNDVVTVGNTTCQIQYSDEGVFLSQTPAASVPTILREDFVENPPHIPVAQSDLVQGHFLTLTRWGEGQDQLKRSFHEKIKNDPHYIWNGLCGAPGAVTFAFPHALDLSAEGSHLSLRTKNAGKSVIQIVLKTDSSWVCADERIGKKADWTESDHSLVAQTWRAWSPETLEVGDAVTEVDFSEVYEFGFFFPETPNKSKDCIRLDWFALSSPSMALE